MKAGARIAAAIEVLGEVLERHRPCAQALSDWGRAHRFAGSGDRAAIGNLVYDALRRRRSLAFRMTADTPRALAIAAAPGALGLTPSAVAAAADGSPHAPEALSVEEKAGLERGLADDLAAPIAGDFPDWLLPSLERAFGARAAAEGAALAARAPVDMRVNTLKADRNKVAKALAAHGAVPTLLSPLGLRIPPPVGAGRTPNVEAEPAHGKGWFEIQDEGAQVAALMAGAGPRMQVMDLCAGAGGKTLALAASLRNTGQIYAYDRDKSQLRPIFERLKRAGVRNAQVMDAGDEAALSALGARFDVVFADVPCTGTGVWRRRPDSKWRVKPQNIAERQAEQQAALAAARSLVKPGGRLVYVTCSILPEENGDQVARFLEGAPEFAVVPYARQWQATIGSEPPRSADGNDETLLLTPASHSTDGFFIAVLERRT